MEDIKEITIVYTYFGQEERIKGILEEKHPNARVVIVDDCSEKPLEAREGLDIYRIENSIEWNQPGARNLGFQESEGWIVCADIDHLVTRDNIDELLKMEKKKGTIYYLGREDTDSWNIFLMHKDAFEKLKGYDENFCGHYGYDDIDFLWRCYANLSVKLKREIKAKVFAEESSSHLKRDGARNEERLFNKGNKNTNNGRRIRFKWHKL